MPQGTAVTMAPQMNTVRHILIKTLLYLTANWLLFSAGLIAAFCSRLVKISHRSTTHVPGSQGGATIQTLADRPLQEHQK
jgi:hypothetical protein